jgi:hypothetical protein
MPDELAHFLAQREAVESLVSTIAKLNESARLTDAQAAINAPAADREDAEALRATATKLESVLPTSGDTSADELFEGR